MQCNKVRFASLVQRLEQKGCVIEHHQQTEPQTITALIPGIDQWCLLPMGSTGAALQRLFWNKVEFRLDRESGNIHSSWNYASRGNLFLHGLISSFIVLCLAGKVDVSKGMFALLIANGVLAGAAYLETWRVRQWAKDVLPSQAPCPEIELTVEPELEIEN